MRPVVGRTPGGIEDLLLKNESELKLLVEYNQEDLYVIEYSCQTPLAPLDIYVMRLKKDKKTKDQTLKIVGKKFQQISERKYPGMMPHTATSLFSIEAKDSLIFYLTGIPPPTIKSWRTKKRKITRQELKPIEDRINSIKAAVKDKGEVYAEEIERYFKQLSRLH